IRRPHGLRRLEYEGELAVVIGRTASQINRRHYRDYILGYITLHPGDVLLTGSPDGVGPLTTGDRVDIDIDGIGVLTNTVH
ncbi:fumarylacetoacetate hydrolase family protein, partial [Nonomuraea typhae]|uniref:fumarylacetoacetate hydrolase family protein n=1 Tax=Nonomuraea typhae TaxID=2603600 RepID=UPI001CA5C9C9